MCIGEGGCLSLRLNLKSQSCRLEEAAPGLDTEECASLGDLSLKLGTETGWSLRLRVVPCGQPVWKSVGVYGRDWIIVHPNPFLLGITFQSHDFFYPPLRLGQPYQWVCPVDYGWMSCMPFQSWPIETFRTVFHNHSFPSFASMAWSI